MLHAAKKLIGGGKTVGLVDILEVSNVQSHQHQGHFLAAGLSKKSAEFTAVICARQIVISGQLIQPLLGTARFLAGFPDAVI